MSIKLSPKYGVNPSMCTCFFCGEVKSIALMGRINDETRRADKEAPKYVCMDYEPCDKCAEQFSQGVLLIGCSVEQPEDKRPPMKASDGTCVYPTGAHCVIKPEAVNRMFNSSFEAGNKVFVEHELLMEMLNN